MISRETDDGGIFIKMNTHTVFLHHTDQKKVNQCRGGTKAVFISKITNGFGHLAKAANLAKLPSLICLSKKRGQI